MCAKFSKSKLKYIWKCKQRKQENRKRGRNKSFSLHVSLSVASTSCSPLSFKSLQSYYKEMILNLQSVPVQCMSGNSFTPVLPVDISWPCGWCSPCLPQVNNLQRFVWRELILCILRKQNKSKMKRKSFASSTQISCASILSFHRLLDWMGGIGVSWLFDHRMHGKKTPLSSRH